MIARPICRPIVNRIARAVTAGVRLSVVVEQDALGIGSTTTEAGQLYMSTLPANPFNPTQYGWELYGEEQ